MDYPRDKLSVYLLDDGGTDQKCNSDNPVTAHAARARRAELQKLCADLGVHYLTREKNVHAKAGNLNAALPKTSGDLVAVFDADHAPTRDFLVRTVGHFADDPRLFLVQTPHFFLNPDPVERNLSLFEKMPSENEMFYGVIQRGLDKWNATFFGGSAALLRRAALAPAARKVDESALRYYAEHNEADYFAAEVKRLRTLYPEWTPPADSASLAAEDNSEARLWDFFAKGDWDGLGKAVAALRAQRPDWAMSADLAAKVADAKARTALLAASDAGDWAKVKQIAAEHPALNGCADLEAAWRIAAAKAQTGEQAAALGDYRALLSTCTDAPGRRATVEKALASLGPAAARPLVALGAKDASGKGEFDDLALAFTRAKISARLADAGAAEPPAEAVKAFADAALDASTADAQLLGWFFRQKGDHKAALEAFEAASTLLSQGADAAERPKIVEGIVLSLAGVDRRAEAIDLAEQPQAAPSVMPSAARATPPASMPGSGSISAAEAVSCASAIPRAFASGSAAKRERKRCCASWTRALRVPPARTRCSRARSPSTSPCPADSRVPSRTSRFSAPPA